MTTFETSHNQRKTDTPVQLKRFLLIGAERSGSTMLRLMIDHHPELSCMFDSDFLVRFYPECRDAPLSRLEERLNGHWHFRHSGLAFPKRASTYREVIDDFLRQRAAERGKTRVGATIHHDFRYLTELFPDVKYIHLVRDGRPVAASVVKMGWSGNAFCAARRWREAIEEVGDLQSRIPADHWHEVSYEALVHEPEPRLKEICTFLGVEYSNQMLRFHDDTTYAPVDASIASRWKRQMSPREIYQVEMAVGELLDLKGFERMFPPATPGAIERAMLFIDDRVRRALFNVDRYGLYLVVARKLSRLLGLRRTNLERRFQAMREAHIK